MKLFNEWLTEGLDPYSSLMSHPNKAVEYMAKHGPIKQLIDLGILEKIKQDPMAALNYARLVIKGRWEEAEPVIMRSNQAAISYASMVIKGRWKEAEPEILKDPKSAVQYVINVSRKGYRIPEAERIIITDPKAAQSYARSVLQGRWKEAEPVIMKDPRSALNYARFIINGRWKEAEPIIMRSPEDAVLYARDVIKGRWPEAESEIAKHKEFFRLYQGITNKGKHGELLSYLDLIEDDVDLDSLGFIDDYLDLLFQSLDEMECHPLTADDLKVLNHPAFHQAMEYDPMLILSYVKLVVRGRYEKGEPALREDPDTWEQYIEFLGSLGITIE